MNTRHFACLDCKQYVNAGYRWCYTYLEDPGIVVLRERVDVEKVLAAAEYWSVPPETQWLEDLLPRIHSFLLDHRQHELRFGEAYDEHFYSYSGSDYLDWDDIGAGEPSDISVQSLYARGCRKWADVEAYMQSRRRPVWWWGQPEIMEVAQKRFAECVNNHRQDENAKRELHFNNEALSSDCD